ncbi:MAG TPA: head GIN domain-containing protein [Spirochaetia bacterium]|nr:head GIN domain-containing protein [Spirochaetales bacterium]HRS66748.1 head GIN domain-containing protein [Spirochaetia bacterium]HPD79893.1 head GIN domain-containing protein [Spirochaetales bacterium]HQG40104.1 head GIN domain-containing protein [Spirochaetales bacterium]HQK33252.1 head GIN domain-containing protein [Spirochaetales bacterium]
MKRKTYVFMMIGITLLVIGIIAVSIFKDTFNEKISEITNNPVLFAQTTNTFFTSTGISGSGTLKQETRAVRDFSSIDMSGVGVVHLRQAQQYKVVIELDDNLLQYYETVVRNGVLEMHFKPDIHIRNLKELNIYIDMPDLKGLSLSGTTTIIFDTSFSIKLFRADISGASKITGTLYTDTIAISASGATAVTLAGKTQSLTIDVSGTGNFDCLALSAQKAYIDASGAASLKVSVSDYLKVDISGASSVQYKGNPKIDKDISGIGFLKAIN